MTWVKLNLLLVQSLNLVDQSVTINTPDVLSGSTGSPSLTLNTAGVLSESTNSPSLSWCLKRVGWFPLNLSTAGVSSESDGSPLSTSTQLVSRADRPTPPLSQHAWTDQLPLSLSTQLVAQADRLPLSNSQHSWWLEWTDQLSALSL